MAFTPEDIRANRDYFAEKLKSEKGRSDVLYAAEGKKPYDFVLLDTRGGKPFAEGHIPGAWSVNPENLEAAIPQLPKDRELVTYCWGHD
jgi:rhodanese-related sulfurtransferase